MSAESPTPRSPEEKDVLHSKDLFVRLASLALKHGRDVPLDQAAAGEHTFRLHPLSGAREGGGFPLSEGQIKQIDFCPSYMLDGQPSAHRITVTFRDPDLKKQIILELEPGGESATSFTEIRMPSDGRRLPADLSREALIARVGLAINSLGQEASFDDMLTIGDTLLKLENEYHEKPQMLA